MISFITIAICIPFMPALFSRFGILRIYTYGLLLNAFALSCYALTEDFVFWCLTAGFGGLGGALAIGPLLPAMIGLNPNQALWLAATIGLCGWLAALNLRPLKHFNPTDSGRSVPAALKPRTPGGAAQELNPWGAIKTVPSLCLIAFAGGVFEAGLNSISAAHGSRMGLSLAAATSIVAAVGIGSFLIQYPAGVLADRMPGRQVFSGAAVMLFGSSLLLLASTRQPDYYGCRRSSGAGSAARFTR